MPFIMPSGNRIFNWSPKSKDEKLTKTASTGAVEEQTDKDLMYELAKKVIAKRTVAAQEEQKKYDFETQETQDKVDEDLDIADVELETEEVSEETSEKKPCCDDDVVIALENLEDAVAEVKDAVAETHEEDEDNEFVVIEESDDDEVVDETEPTESTFEVSIDEADKDDGEIIVQSEEECAEEGPAQKQTQKVEASSNDDFVKLSQISPETRKKTAEFWKKYLGYPADYVDLMVKNYK
jgi:hypothetical protein